MNSEKKKEKLKCTYELTKSCLDKVMIPSPGIFSVAHVIVTAIQFIWTSNTISIANRDPFVLSVNCGNSLS